MGADGQHPPQLGPTGEKVTVRSSFCDVNCTGLAWNHGRSIHDAPSGSFDGYVRIEHVGYRQACRAVSPSTSCRTPDDAPWGVRWSDDAMLHGSW